MNYSDIRAQARDRLAGNWASAVGICLVAFLLGGAIAGAEFLPQITYTFRGETMELKEWLTTVATLTRQFGSTTISIGALGLAQFIIGGVVQLGYARHLLKQHDRQDCSLSDLFSELDRFGQGFAQKFLRALYVFLWSLLLVIPGVIKDLSYAMTPFIMADHPNLTAGEAIERSKALMDGYKWDLFVLRFTFIGWNLLAALTMNVGNLILNPYKNAAEAAFYRQIAGYPKYTVE